MENNKENGLENLHKYSPKPEAWDNIQAALEEDDKPKIVYWRWFGGIAATLAIMFAIYSVLPKQNVEELSVQFDSQENQKTEVKDSTKDAFVETEPVLQPTPETPENTVPTTGPNDGKAGAANNQTYHVSVVGNTTLACADSVTLNFANVGAANTYQWSATSDQSATLHGYTSPGSYNVTTSPITYQVTSIASSNGLTANSNAAKFKESNAYDDAWEVEDDYDGIAYYNEIDDEEPATPIKEYDKKPINIERGRSDIGSKGDVDYFRNVEPVITESYNPLVENTYLSPYKEPLSTFGIDVDNASYAVMRTKINSGTVVPKDAVRVEEFVNYFDYNYPQPGAGKPFSINLENADCPWNPGHQLVRIGLKGKDIDYNKLQNSNLVFLIDVSGSMGEENKLPLVKKSMKLLVDQMGHNDKIAIVTYAGAAGLALPSTRCDEKEFIKKKIDHLDAGGSTAGGEGIKLAYKVALENLIADGNNRVIMCTDGDFNVGQSSDADMKSLIISNRNKGIFITACGFGMGNYQDSKMETIADNGNGNYFYIDTYRESEKVFNREMRATLFTIAKDVKIQVEFNPKHVKAYRLIGYENRKMPPEHFNDDTKDGGELGAGHTVTALYELIPATSEEQIPGSLDLKYQKTNSTTTNTNFGDELLTIKLRYKEPNGETSKLLTQSLKSGTTAFSNASQDFRFAAGVALFAQQLRQSEYIEQKDFDLAKRIVTNAKGADVNGDRDELITIINKATNNYNVYSKE